MSSLYELVHNLSSKEVSTVKNFLHFLSSGKLPDGMLSGRLFDYLLGAETDPSDTEACTFVYGTDEDKQESFKKLKYRLKSKILDSLLTDLDDEKKEMMDEVDYAAFRVKKKSIQSRLLFFSNPQNEVASELLEEVIAECKKFEFYGILVEHLSIKRWRYTFKNGEKEFDKVIAEAQHYKECDDAYIKANDYYYKLIFIAEKNEKDEAKVRTFLADAISELSNLVISTKSNLIKYYLKFFEIYYYMKCKNYLRARDICAELADVTSRSPAVRRKQRIGIAYDYFSRCELHLENFDKAIEYTRKAQENFGPCSYNYTISKEQEFYALFYNGQFKEAEAAALTMLNTASRKELGEFRFAKYNFLHANVLFRQGKFSEAARILSEKWEITNDKEHWEIELRILGILTAIELDKHDTAGSQIESLRKFVQRNEKVTPASPRNKIIVKFLLQAKAKRFSFDQQSDLLAQLSDPGKEYAWQVLSAELIPFHIWVKEKTPAALRA